MHYGYRIVEDMIDGLSEYLDSHGMKSVHELVGRAVPAYEEWGDLDLAYKVVAKIDPKTCIGCQLCVDRLPGRRAPVHLHRADDKRPPAARPRAGHGARPRSRFPVGAIAGDRVPWIDEPECVGLQPLPARVPGARVHHDGGGRDAGPQETWNDRVRAGRDKVPGGIHDD